MLKAKLLAMCVCPALLAPPTILAIHKPSRHAVAHLLHRAAERLDQAPPAAVAAVDCLPVVAGGGGPGGLPAMGDSGIYEGGAGSLGSGGFLPAAYGSGGFIGSGGAGGGGGGTGGGGGGGTLGPGGSSGGGPSTPPGVPVGDIPVSVPPVSSPPVGTSVPPFPINGGGGIASGTPEPAAWLLMVTGFGAVGLAVRNRRPLRSLQPVSGKIWRIDLPTAA